MAYELHIERENQPIGLDEWKGAVAATDGARVNSEDAVATNPTTGKTIRIGGNEGDVEICHKSGGFLGIGAKESWVKVIRFRDGRASFKATADIELPNNPIRKVVASLAEALSARIVGDEGEEYEW